MTEIQNGTVVCYTGTPEFQAVIGGYNGTDHLLTQRSDNGPNIWTSRFRVGTCAVESPPPQYFLIAVVIIVMAILYMMIG